MQVSQVVFSFFRYRPRHALNAFILTGFQGLVRDKRMPPGRVRLMGCGGSEGFSIVPDLRVYCVVSALEDPNDLDALRRTRFYKLVSGAAIEQLHFHLEPLRGHGTWDGEEPFVYSNRQDPDQPFAVLTHARVAPARAFDFWRSVPAVRAHLHETAGCLYTQGFGENPLLVLATFSIWENLAAMQSFAYRQSPHHRTLQAARTNGWLTESIFARFGIERIEGDLDRYPRLEALMRRSEVPAQAA